jgi:hypothetical protein
VFCAAPSGTLAKVTTPRRTELRGMSGLESPRAHSSNARLESTGGLYQVAEAAQYVRRIRVGIPSCYMAAIQVTIGVHYCAASSADVVLLRVECIQPLNMDADRFGCTSIGRIAPINVSHAARGMVNNVSLPADSDPERAVTDPYLPYYTNSSTIAAIPIYINIKVHDGNVLADASGSSGAFCVQGYNPKPHHHPRARQS